MIKYFVSYSYKRNGNQEFGWTAIESEHHFTSEQDLIDVTEVLKKITESDRPIILSFQVLSDSNVRH